MPTPASTLSLFLRQHLHHADLSAYEVSQRIDLICSQACSLAEMNAQPLHGIHFLKAILHTPENTAEQLLTQNGLTLEKIHNTPLTPLESPFDFDRLFTAMMDHMQDGTTLGTEHLLLALLDQDDLMPYFAYWGVNKQQLWDDAQRVKH